MSWAEADKTPALGRVYSETMAQRLGPARDPEAPLEDRHRNLAASLQARLEEVYLGMLRRLAPRTGLRAGCLAGGVGFNCVGNGKIFDETPFEQVYVQPAAGDGGLAVGAAVYLWRQVFRKPRAFVMGPADWGPEVSKGDIRAGAETGGAARKGSAGAAKPDGEVR